MADASVFPSSLGVNPQLTTMAVATTIARQLTVTL
ncbi:MAG: GMC oxidoreductase [Myxococcota bacterium]|nr:GMC oxidoreductase [Myxococcota bacterium]